MVTRDQEICHRRWKLEVAVVLRPSLKLGSKGKMLKKNVKDYLFQIYIYIIIIWKRYGF